MKLTNLRLMVMSEGQPRVKRYFIMKKKLIVAVTTALILSSGSSIALASGSSGDSSTTSTTAPTRSRLTNSQRAAQRAQNEARKKYLADLAKYLQTRKTIESTFRVSMVNAQRAFNVARQSATTPLARRTASQVFVAAIATATANKVAALQDLGDPPVKP